MLGTSPSPRQAQSNDDQSGSDIVPGCASRSIHEQPRSRNQPESEQQVNEAERSRDLCHGADRDRDNKCSDKMIAIGYHSIGAENETRDHKPSTDTAASKQGPGNGTPRVAAKSRVAAIK
jgi:hypothetical protein